MNHSDITANTSMSISSRHSVIEDKDYDRISRGFARAASVLSIAVGVVVLAGWILDWDLLKGAIGVPITMKTNAAVCFILCALGLLLRLITPVPTRLIVVVCTLILTIALLTFIQHASGMDFGIDQLLFTEQPGAAATASPNRMGPPASLSFTAIATTLLLMDWPVRRRYYPFRYLVLAATLISMIPLVGYTFGAASLYSTIRRTEIAWPTSVTLFVLSLGVLAARPQNAIVRTFLSANLGGLVARRLLLPSVAIPFFLLLVYGQLRDTGRLDPIFGRAILAVVMMIGMTSLVLITAYRIVIVSDAQTRAERRLIRSQQELGDFFDNSAIGLHLVDASGVIIRANHADMDLLGYSADEYIGRPLTEFHADPNVARELLAALKRGQAIRDYPARLRHKDGSTRDVLIDSSGLWEDGKFVHSRCFTRDVTDRNRGEEFRRQLSAIVESSYDAIVGEDINGRIISWNRAAEQMFGYTAAEMVGRSISTLIPSDRAGDELRILQCIRNGESVEHYETARKRKDGLVIDVSLTLSPIRDSSGVIIGASKIARNISEQKRIVRQTESLLEQERIARTEAEHAARMRDEFLAVVSHELRTPLNSILGWAQLMKRASGDSDILNEGVEAIERGARAQAQLIDDLLDMNRIAADKLQLDMRTVALSGIIETTIALMKPTADEKKIVIDVAMDATVGAIRGDANRLQQVFWNLLSNAVKFTPEHGTITVGLRRDDPNAEIVVRDTGVGIRADFLPHIFERFRQEDSSITRTHGGLGLGLAIVKQLVEMHGGTIRAESEGAHMGTTFIIALPLLRDSTQPDSAAAAHPPKAIDGVDDLSLEGIRVLVVDDQADTCELLERLIVEWGGEASTASNAEEAIDKLKRELPSVLVSDIGLPGIDGYELIYRIRNLPPDQGGKTPAIALTAFTRPEDRARTLLSGYQMHLAKPMDPNEFVAMVASLTSRSIS